MDTDAPRRGPAPVYFEIVSAPGGYRAQIRGSDHELLFWSEAYVTKGAARSAVDLVQAGAGSAPVRDLSTGGFWGAGGQAVES